MSTATAVRLDLPPIERLELVHELALTTTSRLNEIKEEIEGHVKDYDHTELDLDRDSLDEADVGRLLLFANELKEMGGWIQRAAREVEEEVVGLYQRAHQRETTSDRLRLLGLVQEHTQETREWLEASKKKRAKK